MGIPSSGQLKLNADINLEINGSATGTNVSLKTLSDAAGFTDPDNMFEFYGYVDAVVPIVQTSFASMGTTTASVFGNVTSDGGATITDRGIYFGTSSTYTNNTKQSFGSGTTGQYGINFSGLTPGQTYYRTAYAVNSVGEAVGSTLSSATTQQNIVSVMGISINAWTGTASQGTSMTIAMKAAYINSGGAPSSGCTANASSYGPNVANVYHYWHGSGPGSSSYSIGSGSSFSNTRYFVQLTQNTYTGAKTQGMSINFSSSGYQSGSITSHTVYVS